MLSETSCWLIPCIQDICVVYCLRRQEVHPLAIMCVKVWWRLCRLCFSCRYYLFFAFISQMTQTSSKKHVDYVPSFLLGCRYLHLLQFGRTAFDTNIVTQRSFDHTHRAREVHPTKKTHRELRSRKEAIAHDLDPPLRGEANASKDMFQRQCPGGGNAAVDGTGPGASRDGLQCLVALGQPKHHSSRGLACLRSVAPGPA